MSRDQLSTSLSACLDCCSYADLSSEKRLVRELALDQLMRDHMVMDGTPALSVTSVEDRGHQLAISSSRDGVPASQGNRTHRRRLPPCEAPVWETPNRDPGACAACFEKDDSAVKGNICGCTGTGSQKGSEWATGCACRQGCSTSGGACNGARQHRATWCRQSGAKSSCLSYGYICKPATPSNSDQSRLPSSDWCSALVA